VIVLVIELWPLLVKGVSRWQSGGERRQQSQAFAVIPEIDNEHDNENDGEV
jgi:hypothetical protein